MKSHLSGLASGFLLSGLALRFSHGTMHISVSGFGNAMRQVGNRLQIRRVVSDRQRRGTGEDLVDLPVGETNRPHGGHLLEPLHRSARIGATLGVVSFAYSWLPGTGANLMPRSATPSGFGLAASMVIAEQMMFVDVAAIAVVPELRRPVFIVKPA